MARLVGTGGDVFITSQLIEDCEDAWDELVDGDVTSTLDTSIQREGSGCVKLAQATPLANGDILATEVIGSTDLSSYTILLFWARSSVNITTADDYRILLDNHASGVSPEVECSVPTLTAGVWKYCQGAAATGAFSSANAVISVGCKLIANDPGAANIFLDGIRAAKTIAGIKSWTLDQVVEALEGTGFDSGGNRQYVVGLKGWSGSFEGFKDGAPLTIGTQVGLELRESSTATQQFRGTVIITGMHPVTPVDGLVTYAYDFQGVDILEIPTA